MGLSKYLIINLVIISLILSMFTNLFLIGPLIIFSRAGPGDIPSSWDNSTVLNVTVLEKEPRINWYDFQYNNTGTWQTALNQQIDIDNSREYRFIVNISSDQGWADIEWINITAWHDLGNDASTYNQTLGGNINLNFTYENTTGTGKLGISEGQKGEDSPLQSRTLSPV